MYIWGNTGHADFASNSLFACKAIQPELQIVTSVQAFCRYSLVAMCTVVHSRQCMCHMMHPALIHLGVIHSDICAMMLSHLVYTCRAILVEPANPVLRCALCHATALPRTVL